ncbi:lytic transglycosylase domain-containing protein [Accumulibacter sp.]|uniref:lytic transglycosylase domain-containing protein n=1 Tax=Accumulibacter sp. TaxID=2053492 RepID=UPI001A58A664|nr:lytic transglycosylase domain-containing protein [Accumulibacter sp.]MBL8373786.1 lytic transglycosylase domain-containing protein [Accumulibacter sp.]
MQVLNVILMLGLGLVSASACANIYGYIDEQGAAHFATEKIDARYQLFLRGKQFDPSEVTSIGPVKPELARYLSQHPNLKKFEPLLKVASDEFSVEPALLKAVMAAESGFNPGAISPKGAIGLMQVMPATAERYGLQGDRNKSIEQKLADPETNIRLGARYLRDLSRRFPNQQELVLASYNAGEGAVQQYKNQIPPYPETRNYVQLVTQFYQLYQAGTATGKYQAKVFTRSGPTAKRLYMTLPGRRNMPTSAAADNHSPG